MEQNINQISLEHQIQSIFKNDDLSTKLYVNKRNGYIVLGVLVIVGIVLILIGAFFQQQKNINILITLDVIGSILILIGLFFSFYAPILNYHILKKYSIKHLSDKKLNNLYSIILMQNGVYEIVDCSIQNKYITYVIDNYAIKWINNNLFLNINNENILLNKNIFDVNIVFNIKKIDNLKGSNIESFSTLIEQSIKKHSIKMLTYLSNIIKDKDGFNK